MLLAVFDFYLILTILTETFTMDTALKLKIEFDRGNIKTFGQAKEKLSRSEVLRELSRNPGNDVLNIMNNLIQLAEIPFTKDIPEVQERISKMVRLGFCNDGFSYSGKSDDILSCYNSMITSLLIYYGFDKQEYIKAGIEWILKYQNFERGMENMWNGSSVLKYGGCMKKTPCYIGVVKAVKALSDYKHSSIYQSDNKVEDKLAQGLEYILSHNLYHKKSKDKPITGYITKLTYPFSYKTNIIELLHLMKDNGLIDDPRCSDAKQLLLKKRKKGTYWSANRIYSPKGWIDFDNPGEPGEWISYKIEKVL